MRFLGKNFKNVKFFYYLKNYLLLIIPNFFFRKTLEKRLSNFTKNEIRETAKSVGLSVYDKPSNSCLASRIPWGQKITTERLLRIELGESIVKQVTSLKQVRVRDMNGIAKLEIERIHIQNLDNKIITEIKDKLKTIGFSDLIIDPDGYEPGKINVIAD